MFFVQREEHFMPIVEFLAQEEAGELGPWKTEGRSTTFMVTYVLFWNDAKLVANQQSVPAEQLPRVYLLQQPA